MSQIFFESAEQSFDESSATQFFARFPQGEYEIEGMTPEGDALENEVMLTKSSPKSWWMPTARP